MPTIRTIFQPDTPREVDDHEAAQLEREGLLLPLEETPVEPAPEAAPAPAAAPTPPAKPAKEATGDGGKQEQ
jgi:hypothetical protein